MNRAVLDDYRFALEARLTHQRQTGRGTIAHLGDLVLLLDALLAEPEPVIERASPAADAQWARDRALADLTTLGLIPGLVSMGAPGPSVGVSNVTAGWPDYVRCHGMTVRMGWEPDPLENWSA